MLDVVALTRDMPELSLVRGQVGTTIEQLDGDHWEVEFVDDNGRTYSMVALPANTLLVLRHGPIEYA
jgi:hypothetical protein